MSNHPGKTRSLPAESRRRGFTLFEILLALGLTVVLLATVFATISLFRQLTTAGRDDVEESQIVRAILRKVELDIRACFLPKPDDGSAGQSSRSAEGDTDVEATADPAAAVSATSVGLVGDLNTLVIHINKPSRDANTLLLGLFDETQAVPESGDLKSVSYFLAVPGADGLQGLIGSLVSNASDGSTAGSGVLGLARLEGDRLIIDSADAQGDYETLAAQTKILAQEINYLEFHYFDGIEWYESWDSSTEQRLPNAVEIILGFRVSGNADSPASSATAGDTSSRLYRFVVALPLAEPPILSSEM